jgi:plasmid replication initiation protein
MKKINDFKNNALKVERVPNVFENLNSFETMLKMIKKNDANVLKTYFLDFQCFSLFLNFSENLSKHGSKNWVATRVSADGCI